MPEDPSPYTTTESAAPGRTGCGLDRNERLPNGEMRQTAIDHPENFTRNTGAGASVEPDRAPTPNLPRDAEALIIPTDSLGG